MLRNLWRDQRGQDLPGFALLAAFTSAAVMTVSPAMLSVGVYLHQALNQLQQVMNQMGGF